jgi:Zn-dependent protease
VWLFAILGAGGVVAPPFWSGVGRSALFMVGIVVLTIARELGRLVLGCALGLRPAIVELGEGVPLARFRTGRLLWVIGQIPIVSATVWEPPTSPLALRWRMALLALARPAVAGLTILAFYRAGVPLMWGAGASPVAGELLRAAELLLLVGLIPFAISGQTVVPVETDGLKLVKVLFGPASEAAQAFARYYYAGAREALNDSDPARALSLAREGLRLYGPPWSNVLQTCEAMALGRTGDRAAAMARLEAQLAGDLQPAARSLALNNWSWYAFLARDEKWLRLADRRSADAVVLKPDTGPVAGTRGAILLWQGRVAEAVPLLERGHAGALSQQGRDNGLCLLALATAARRNVVQAQGFLRAVRHPDRTDDLWQEAERAVQAAAQPEVALVAARGSRAAVIGPDGVELREGSGAQRRISSSDLRWVEIGRTVRGRVQILIRTDRGTWRLPIAASELTWARMLFGQVAAQVRAPEPTATAAEHVESVETQERAYQERARAAAAGVSTPRGVLLLASLVAFGASMMLISSWQWIGALIPILFVHELGHWIAMRAFGHRDARIAFIPLMGAATMTRTPFRKRWQEIVMLLAGPVPGILAGIVLILAPATRHMPQLRTFAVTALSINTINLLPLHPLDGGRIMQALVTAGRPRLDLAFKTAGGLLFALAGWKMHDPLVSGLGVMGLLLWPQARRLSTLERRIRSTPGFDTRLTPEARRAYIFRALAHEPALKGKDWASTVATLEGPLGYQPTPGWQIGLGVLALVALVMGGSVLGSRWLSRRSASWHCPGPSHAAVLACDAVEGSAVAWTPDASGAVGAFVWCGPPGTEELDDDVVDRVGELEIASRYCAALPWTDAKGWGDEAVTRARRTLWRLDDSFRVARSANEEKQAVEQAAREPDFDPEIARLIRERAHAYGDRDRYLAIHADIARRVGKVAGQCDDTGVTNVEPTEDGARFGLVLKDRAALPRLSSYLCKLGCRVSVLPAAPDDRRLRVCF